MRHLLPALALLAAASGLPAAPAVPEAASFRKWIDPGWKPIALARGDLDGDGRSDAALVVEKDDPANRRRNAGPGATVLNLNPRRLLILFANDAGYAPAARIDRFLPSEHRADAPCLADPLEGGGVGIRRFPGRRLPSASLCSSTR